MDPHHDDIPAGGSTVVDGAGSDAVAADRTIDESDVVTDHRIPDELPLLPLRDSVVFPGTILPIKIVRPSVQRVIEAAAGGRRMLCLVAQRRPDVDEPKLADLYRVGTACSILKISRDDEDGDQTLIIQGLSRVGIVSIAQETPYLVAVVHARPEFIERTKQLDALAHTVRINARRAIELSPHVPEEALEIVDSITTAHGLADFLAANLALPIVSKQELLETFDVRRRLDKVNVAINRQIEVLEISDKIQRQVRTQMDNSQREYYLREELKAIQTELGVTDSHTRQLDKIADRIAAAKMPKPVDEQARRELDRLRTIPQASPDYSNTLDYLDWLCSLPWSVSVAGQVDIARAAQILDEDHYGLKNIKKRILEFLAVRKLKPDGRGPILCFAGPPGVGKTSLGQSIARALGRTFVRLSLGGARDEADIRGHRRTYVGALPGRLIQGLRRAGSNNPVFMLDEVDKLGQDFRGDPASALLEVLDPAQNATFVDHYLDVPFDLSRVLFIATANYMGGIPAPLRDRMEVISLSGYTPQEKLQIARQYLVPRQIDENGLDRRTMRFDDDALRTIIAGYTSEAGVRNLERTIASVCRARAAAVVSGKRAARRVTAAALERYLGQPTHESEVASDEAVPGVVTGLAYTPVGGEILFVEVTRMAGSGGINITGQIGDVMRESAQAAFSIARSRSAEWGIDAKAWQQFDFHIHVPAGAIPKDGPSAGVAMFAALASLMTGRAVDPTTGMTGEITLRGAVLPVGGIREKLLAAHRAGLKRVVIPQRNLKDLDDLPSEVRDDLQIVPVRNIQSLLATIFAASPGRGGGKRTRPASTAARASRPARNAADAQRRKTAADSRRATSGSARRKSAVARKTR
ncbi:MAG: endopeptidase La [Phycisphaerales bacterium]|nr:endopeptidase La [Phycisphaerales bacterium]